MIESAASAVGKSSSEFILESARRDATDLILDRRRFVLNAGPMPS